MPERDLREMVRAWRDAASRLESLRHQRLRHVDTEQGIESLDDAFESALSRGIVSVSSGLVAQQAVFMRMSGEVAFRARC